MMMMMKTETMTTMVVTVMVMMTTEMITTMVVAMMMMMMMKTEKMTTMEVTMMMMMMKTETMTTMVVAMMMKTETMTTMVVTVMVMMTTEMITTMVVAMMMMMMMKTEKMTTMEVTMMMMMMKTETMTTMVVAMMMKTETMTTMVVTMMMMMKTETVTTIVVTMMMMMKTETMTIMVVTMMMMMMKTETTTALDMSQAFDTVNHYTLIEKLISTNTPNLITRFIANYIRGRKAFTQYKNKNSFKKQFKAGVPQGGVLSPTLFNIYMSDLPTPPRDIHVTTYADDITIYSSDKNYTIAQQRLQPYLEDVQTWTKANDLKLNASKTMTTLFTPDPAEYRDELSLQLDNTRLPTIRNPKILGLTFDPKLTFNEHIKTSKDKAEKTINILKALTSTHWGKNKETLTNTYKTVTRPILEYAGTIYAPIISDKQLTALQVTQNQGLRIATGCTSDTNINHIHDETKILPIEKHLRLHSSQLRQKASHPDHPLHRLTTQPQPPRLKKKTIFNNNQYTLNIDPDPTHAIDENTIKRNMKTIHTTIVQDHLSNRPINKLLNRPPPDIDKKEETLPHSTRRKLSQLRTNKSPLLMTYLHKIDPANHPAANCPLCNDPNHDSLHLFNCPDIPTTLTVWDLWTDPVGVAALLDVWGEKLGGPRAGV